MHKIEETFGISVTSVRLGQWYRDNQVVRARPNYNLSTGFSKEAKLKLQQDFCVKLIQYWKAGREIVFIDEVSKKPDGPGWPGWPCACSFTNFSIVVL